ncbi:MAG: response regulator transcription factor [Oscillospiraceae bacterium]|nr:response regulator transcription factor [Oscillospiraceae bacterium]
MSNKILIIDDDPNVYELLKLYLSKENYEVITAQSGQEGVAMFKFHEPYLVLLDIMMPGKDGWAVCREIREISSAPIIMITAKSEEFDKVLGLELGADDFIVKPFSTKEVCARVKAVLRRTEKETIKDETDSECVKLDNLEISMRKYELRINNKAVDSPPKEIELLFFLVSNPNRVFTREQLLDKVWGFDYLGDSRTVDVHVKRIRDKIDGISEKWRLKTIWSVGYKFELLP